MEKAHWENIGTLPTGIGLWDCKSDVDKNCTSNQLLWRSIAIVIPAKAGIFPFQIQEAEDGKIIQKNHLCSFYQYFILVYSI